MTETKIQEALKWLARQNTAIQLEAWKEAGYQDAYSERKKLAVAIMSIKEKMVRDKRKYSDREQGIQELEETTELRLKALRKKKSGTGRKSRCFNSS